MVHDPGLVFLVNGILSWASLLLTLGGLAICVSNQRLSPKLWLTSVGFAGLLLGGFWNRLGLPFFANTQPRMSPLILLVLMGSIIHLISWSLLVYGLAATFSDLQRRLSRKEDPLEELV